MPGVMQVPQKQGMGLGDMVSTARNAYGIYKDATAPQPQQQPQPVDLNPQAASTPGAIDRRIALSLGTNGNAQTARVGGY